MAEVTEQIVREAPEIEAIKLGLLESAKTLSGTPVNIPAQQIAGFSPLQQQAFGAAEQGVGAFQPYLTEAGFTLGDSQTALGGVMSGASPYQDEAAFGLRQAAAGISPEVTAAQLGIEGALQGATQATGRFNPADIAQYQSPYEELAVQQALADIARQGQIQQQGLQAQAANVGAFGGSRQAIAEQELNRNILDQQARTAAQMRNLGFNTAGQMGQQAFEQQQARLLQAAQLGLTGSREAGQLGLSGQQLQSQLSQGLGTLGVDYGGLGLQQGESLGTLGLRQASLGQQQQALGQGEAGFLFDLGQKQQSQQQAELEAERATQLQANYEPYQRLGFLSDIYKGAPSTQMSLTGSTSPSVSTGEKILGLGIAGLSAAAGASKAGLF